MSGPPPKKSEVFTFQNIFAVAMALWGIYASMQVFREDTTGAVSNMKTDIAWLKDTSKQHGEDIRELRRERRDKQGGHR